MNYSEFFKGLAAEFGYEPSQDYEAFFYALTLKHIGIESESVQLEALYETVIINCSTMPSGKELRSLASKYGLWNDPDLAAFEEGINNAVLYGDGPRPERRDSDSGLDGGSGTGPSVEDARDGKRRRRTTRKR